MYSYDRINANIRASFLFSPIILLFIHDSIGIYFIRRSIATAIFLSFSLCFIESAKSRSSINDHESDIIYLKGVSKQEQEEIEFKNSQHQFYLTYYDKYIADKYAAGEVGSLN